VNALLLGEAGAELGGLGFRVVPSVSVVRSPSRSAIAEIARGEVPDERRILREPAPVRSPDRVACRRFVSDRRATLDRRSMVCPRGGLGLRASRMASADRAGFGERWRCFPEMNGANKKPADVSAAGQGL
jgi:hypothetical protein